MTQIFKGDEVLPVSIIRLDKKDDLDAFKEGDVIKVRGTTKGKGFQGVVKRHGFGGGPKTHGQKNRLRAPGSIGSTAPQRVLPGKKMAGRMGGVKKTILNLKVVNIDKDANVLMVCGSVPGNNNQKIEIRK